MNVERRDVMSYGCVSETHRSVPAAKFRNSNMRQASHLIASSNILVCVNVFLNSLQQQGSSVPYLSIIYEGGVLFRGGTSHAIQLATSTAILAREYRVQRWG